MRETHPPYVREHSPVATFAASAALLGAFFALLVAAAYPVAAAAAGGGATVALLARRTLDAVRRRERLCVPGTRICLRTASV